MTSIWKRILRGDDPEVLSATPPGQPSRPAGTAGAVAAPDWPPAWPDAAPTGRPDTGVAGGGSGAGGQLRARLAAVPRTSFRPGYDIADVDAFVERAAAALDAHAAGRPGPVTADEVLNVRFRSTSFRPGYDQDGIDDLLDEVVHALRS